VYGGWQENSVATGWDQFALVKALSPNFAYSGCGNSHYPPNGTADYDYANPTATLSNCADFVNYSNLGNPATTAQPVNCSQWSCSQLDYFNYWFGYLPHNRGCGTNGVVNDWWAYFAKPDLALNAASACVCYPLTTTVSPGGSGSVAIQPGPNCGAEYAAGTVVRLTAQPNAQKQFSHWSGSASGFSNPLTITMNAAKSITATFVSAVISVPPASVHIQGGALGTVTTAQTFTATVMPVTVSLTLTYTWRATNQAAIVHTGNQTDVVAFQWGAPGVKVVTGTVRGAAGAVTTTHLITISAPIYLPVMQRP
jgi:hypothetical protein